MSITQDVNGLLSEVTLRDVLARAAPLVSPASVARFVQKWSSDDRGLDISAFCSALAQYVKVVQLDEQVEVDWKQISGNGSSVRAEDIARVFGCSFTEAQEMVWEADSDNNGVLSFYDLLDTLSTFRENSQSMMNGKPAIGSI